MELFKKAKNFFGNESKGNIWDVLTESSQLENIVQQSKERPQLIYKHSHRCGTCMITKSNLEQAAGEKFAIKMHFLNVVKRREASDHIASKLGIRHESPQVILINDGEVVWHASHGAINADSISEKIA